MESQFFWGIVAGVLVVLAAFLIPAILQISRTAKAAELFIRTTQEQCGPLLIKLNETLERASRVASELEKSLDNVQHLTKAIGETGDIVSDMNSAIRKIQMFVTVTVSGLGAGVKTALGVLTKGAVEKITSQK